jgi:hypothetical protein
MRIYEAVVAFSVLFGVVASAPSMLAEEEMSPVDTRDVLSKRFTACSVSFGHQEPCFGPLDIRAAANGSAPPEWTRGQLQSSKHFMFR